MHSSTVCSRPRSVNRRMAAAAAPQAFLKNLKLPSFGSAKAKAPNTQQLKEQLLELIEPVQRGLTADDYQRQEIEEVVQQLERRNPTPRALESPLLNGRWRLVYTTSESILGTKKLPFLRPSGPIYQLLDGPNLKAANRETAPLFNQVSAELSPLSVNKVAVQFKVFKLLGLIPVTAPPSARGELAITYLDEEMRISRGDKGNLFVLLMDDPDDRP